MYSMYVCMYVCMRCMCAMCDCCHAVMLPFITHTFAAGGFSDGETQRLGGQANRARKFEFLPLRLINQIAAHCAKTPQPHQSI